MNHLLLSHELRTEAQIWSNNSCEGLKVAHEKFTWSGGEIPHIGRYGGHLWKVFCFSFGCTSSDHTQYRVLG